MSQSTFEWADVTYGVGKGPRSKEILKGISGKLGGGELAAIIGPSGSGKTSLLNILANRVRNKGASQRVGGKILLSGKALEGVALRKRIAYVMQQDLLVATQTPREAMLFSAMLRLPSDVPYKEKKAMVEEMLTDLGLLDCADTFIGDEMIRGISGGEKKRTSIGIELVMRPKLIFLDEPTSGLDSFAAFTVIKKLKDLSASRGCNVLTTIHQPSSELFHTFHSVLLLAKGRAVFYGKIAELSAGLAANERPCPAEYNLADHALFLTQTESEEWLDGLAEKLGTNKTAVSVEEVGEAPRPSENHIVDGQPPGFCTQLVHLSKREFLSVWRNKPGLIASLVIPLVLNLFFACIFLQVGDHTAADWSVNSHFGGMVQVAIGGMFGAAQPLLLKFPTDRGIFLREYATSTYGAAAYFLSRTMVELPQSFINALLVYIAVYWLMGLHGSFVVYVLVFWITGMAAASTALLVGSVASNAEVAINAAPAIFVPQLLFAGFFIRTDQIPDWLSWVQYICSLKYGVNLMILNEFGEDARDEWTIPQQVQAKGLIDYNDIDPNHWWVYLGILLAIITVFRLGAIAALARRASAFF